MENLFFEKREKLSKKEKSIGKQSENNNLEMFYIFDFELECH